MTASIDIHLATDDERRAAHANCHDIWSMGLPLEEHIAYRENSALHRRARWIVGCVDGKVVAGLASHAMRFRLHGKSLAGIGIASVHTLAAFRGQGFAPLLIDWIERFERRQGAEISMLFCDIVPRYYERLGYILCPSHHGQAIATETPLPSSAAHEGLEPMALRRAGESFEESVPRLSALYDSDHGRRAFAVERLDDYWRHLAERRDDAELFWLAGTEGEPRGYVSLREEADRLLIDDHGVFQGDDRLRTILFERVIELARQRGLRTAGGWLPELKPALDYFAIEPRRTEITMVKSLVDGVSVDDRGVSAAAWIQEIDHV